MKNYGPLNKLTPRQMVEKAKELTKSELQGVITNDEVRVSDEGRRKIMEIFRRQSLGEVHGLGIRMQGNASAPRSESSRHEELARCSFIRHRIADAICAMNGKQTRELESITGRRAWFMPSVQSGDLAVQIRMNGGRDAFGIYGDTITPSDERHAAGDSVEVGERWYYYSFAEPGKFLGALYLRCLTDPFMDLYESGLNPGGEVVFTPVPAHVIAVIPDGWEGRLLNSEHASELNSIINKALSDGNQIP